MSLYSEKTVLDEEIESWKGFPWVLRGPDRTTYDKMIEAAKQYADSVEHAGRTFPTESFFMALLLVQHKMIEQLQKEIQQITQANQQTLH